MAKDDYIKLFMEVAPNHLTNISKSGNRVTFSRDGDTYTVEFKPDNKTVSIKYKDLTMNYPLAIPAQRSETVLLAVITRCAQTKQGYQMQSAFNGVMNRR